MCILEIDDERVVLTPNNLALIAAQVPYIVGYQKISSDGLSVVIYLITVILQSILDPELHSDYFFIFFFSSPTKSSQYLYIYFL